VLGKLVANFKKVNHGKLFRVLCRESLSGQEVRFFSMVGGQKFRYRPDRGPSHCDMVLTRGGG
jgi:hypothetical protein